MGTTKQLSFSALQNFRAKYFKALGHPARIAILEMLIEKKSCVCNEMVNELPLLQSTIYHHLKELKDAGIIKGQIESQKMCYCIDVDTWKHIQADMNALFSSFVFPNNCC